MSVYHCVGILAGRHHFESYGELNVRFRRTTYDVTRKRDENEILDGDFVESDICSRNPNTAIQSISERDEAPHS